MTETDKIMELGNDTLALLEILRKDKWVNLRTISSVDDPAYPYREHKYYILSVYYMDSAGNIRREVVMDGLDLGCLIHKVTKAWTAIVEIYKEQT